MKIKFLQNLKMKKVKDGTKNHRLDVIVSADKTTFSVWVEGLQFAHRSKKDSLFEARGRIFEDANKAQKLLHYLGFKSDIKDNT